MDSQPAPYERRIGLLHPVTQAERLFLVPLLAKVVPFVFWAAYLLLWHDWLAPKWRRAVDSAWDRVYVAYWRRKGLTATAPQRERA